MSEQATDMPATRERILDAALNIFSVKGFQEATLNEITAEASISRGSIYFHFPNKEKLFIALVDRFADVLERRVKEAVEREEHIVRRVEVALDAVLHIFGEYRRAAKFLLVQAVGLGAVFERKRMEIEDRFALLIQSYLDEAVADGAIEPVNTAIASQAWVGKIYKVVIHWVYTGEPSREEIKEALLPLLLSNIGYRQ